MSVGNHRGVLSSARRTHLNHLSSIWRETSGYSLEEGARVAILSSQQWGKGHRTMANIVTVESSLSISWLYREILQQEGHRVFCVMRGKEAVDFALKESIDVVIVDERVPTFEAHGLVNELRRLHPGVRAILCTWGDRGPHVDTRLWDEVFLKNDNFTVLQGKVEGLCKEYPDTFSKPH